MNFRWIGSIFLLYQVALLFTIPAVGGAREKAYRIGHGDVITLSIFAGGEKDHESHLTVSERGTINVPFIGAINADGLTPSELEKKIAEPLAKDYFVDPKVNVYLKEYHSLRYYISGAVKKPGVYEMMSEATLMALIAKAEGVLPDCGNVAYIMRDRDVPKPKTAKATDGGEPIKVDLQRLLDQGDFRANLPLKPGDVVYIPHEKSLNLAESKIYVEGEVVKPGHYDFRPGMTAMTATILAGGFSRFAAPNRSRIIRQIGEETQIIKINLNEVRGGRIPDIELNPGDRIHVPETWL